MKLIVRLFIGFSWLILGIILLISSLWFWGITGSNSDQVVEINVNPSSSLSTLSKALTEKDIISHPWLMEYYVKIFHDFSRAKSGKYQFEKGSSAKKIIEKIISGEITKQLVLEVQISPGLNLKQIAAKLNALGLGSYDSIYNLFFDPVFIHSLNIRSNSLEGYLYPETYRYYNISPSASEVIARMVNHFFSVISKIDYKTKLSNLNISLEDAVIFSSLIEKETSFDQEKSMISEVIWNRLNKKIHLGIDAALIYGIKDYDGDITFKHLKDSTNPYNTRIHLGLPPTAISNFTIKSFEAVFTPTSYGYLYYVLIPGGLNKQHKFSKTFKEHNHHVQNLVKFQKSSNF